MENMIEKFFEEIFKIMPFENKELNMNIRNKIHIQSKPKGSILLNEGEYSNRLIFLLEGLVRGFYYQDGLEVTSWILPENNFIFSPSNFFTDQPANESIQLVEDSIVLIMNKSDLQALQENNIEVALLTIKVLEKYLINYDKRVRFLRLNSSERLKNFEKEYPKISSRVKLSNLATFLGLSKSSISHIRSNK